MSGYIRQDVTNNIADGNVINASDFDNEYNAIEAAFHASTGHTHDGTAAEGAPITKIGPTQDVVASASALTPKTDNTVDLGSSTLEYKDLWIDGTANIDSLVADTADINAGTIDGVTIGGAVRGAGSFTTLNANGNTTLGDAVGDTVTINGTATFVNANPTLSAGTANGVLYLDGSKVATSGSALTFDGTGALALANTGNVISTIQSTSTGGSRSATLRLNVANTSGDDPAGAIAFTYGAGFTAAASIEATSTPNILKFLIGATEQMRLTSTGLGIGTSSPNGKLDVASGNVFITQDYELNWHTGGTKRSQIIGDSSNNLKFSNRVGGVLTNTMTLDTSGNLGIGTSSPAERLTAAAGGVDRVGMNISGAITQLRLGSSGAGDAMMVLQYNRSTGSYQFSEGTNGNTGSPDIVIDASGNLGIGTGSPNAKLAFGNASDIAFNTGLGSTGTYGEIKAFNTLVPGTPATNIRFIRDVAVVGNDGAICFDTVNMERMRLDSSGNLGLGVTPSAWGLGKAFEVGALGNAVWGGAGYVDLMQNVAYTSGAYRYSTTAAAARYEMQTGIHAWYTAPSGTAGNAITFTQAMTLDSSGNLGLGVTPSAWYPGYNVIQTPAASFATYFNGTLRIIQNAYFSAATSDNRYVNNGHASDYVQVSGAHQWFTAPSGTAGNAISFTQAMTLDASGNLGVGSTSPVGVLEASSATPVITASQNNAVVTADMLLGAFNAYSYDTSTNSKGGVGGVRVFADGTYNTGFTPSYLAFYTHDNVANNNTLLGAATERARITSGGNLLVGKTASDDTTAGNRITTSYMSSAGTQDYWLAYNTSATAYRFYVTAAGTVFATNTTISAISDQRFKENIVDLDAGLDAVMALKPRKFDWKAGKGKDIKGDRGFIAQEFEQVFPDLIDEWKDPAPEGEEPYKSVRQDLIPVLVKAIQELKAELDATKARLAALEAK